MTERPHIPTFVPFPVYYELERKYLAAMERAAQAEAERDALKERNRELRRLAYGVLAALEGETAT